MLSRLFVGRAYFDLSVSSTGRRREKGWENALRSLSGHSYGGQALGIPEGLRLARE
jgi:hypothetical protein